ncbi:MAG: response regulator [Vicinamibacteria bacterium]
MADHPIRALLVDDSPDFLESAADLLSGPGLEVVGRSTSAADALELLRHLAVEVVLMDLAMPGMDGLEAARRIKACAASPKVVLLTFHDGPEYREAARAAGADAFVAKPEMGRRLVAVLDSLFEKKEVTS